jgi:hypothetical protein
LPEKSSPVAHRPLLASSSSVHEKAIISMLTDGLAHGFEKKPWTWLPVGWGQEVVNDNAC